MPTLVEHVHHDSNSSDSSAATMIVTLVAIMLIVGLVLFFLRANPFNTAPATDNGINIDVEGQLPAPTPDSTGQ